jgi:hypothetical protein
MIKILGTERGGGAIFVCDVCKKRIERPAKLQPPSSCPTG